MMGSLNISQAAGPYIKVISLNEEEEIGLPFTGTTKTVKVSWSSNITDSYVLVYLKKGNTILGRINSSGTTASLGSYTWEFPKYFNSNNDFVSAPAGADYKIKLEIYQVETKIAQGESDGYFSIVQPSITVLSPKGGETWIVGERKKVLWNAVGVDYVIIYIYNPIITGAGSTNYIYDGVLSASNGYYDWTIVQNQLPGGSNLPGIYKIKINGVNNDNIGAQVVTQGESDDYFNIVQPSTTVLSPNGGEKWEIGKTHDIKWRSIGYSSSVEIKIALQDTRYSPFSESPLGEVVIASTQNTGSYTWTIPSELTDSLGRTMKLGAENVYKIEVFSIRPGAECKPEKCDTSDAPFSIEAYAEYLEATANLLRAMGQNRVYRIVNEKRLWVPTISAFNAQGLKWEDIQEVDEAEVTQYPEAKLIQVIDSPKVYYLTESGLKRHIVNSQVFESYDNKWEDIIEVTAAVLDVYPDNNLIRAEGDYKVYKLEDGKKRWIKTAEAFNRLGFDWTKIAPVNTMEVNAYSVGVEIE